MAKLSYTLDEIQFTDIKVPGHLSGTVVSKSKYTSGGVVASTIKGGEIDGIYQTFNAIDIDWNGARVAGETLNTTGELLSLLQTTYSYATTYNVKYGEDGKLYDDKGTEIKVGSDIDINHNHIGISSYDNYINADNQNLTYFDTGWYRIGYFGWSEYSGVGTSDNLIFNIASGGNNRSSSICGSIIQNKPDNYGTPQAKINIINASKSISYINPVFDGIRTVKEVILPQIYSYNSDIPELIHDAYLIYGYPAQVTYFDVHITGDVNPNKQLRSLENNVSYMFSGHGNFVYDNRFLKIPPFKSSFEVITGKSGGDTKTAYIGRTITYKPIKYTSNDITTYFFFGGVDHAGDTYYYNTPETPIRVGSSAIIKPDASEDVVYSVDDLNKDFITIETYSDKSIKITPTDELKDYKVVYIYCTTALESIYKQIAVCVAPRRMV